MSKYINTIVDENVFGIYRYAYKKLKVLVKNDISLVWICCLDKNSALQESFCRR